MKKEYIKLPDIRGQKIRKKYYCASAVKHPAKADIPMMIWILKKFVKDGDIVLDPMAGIGGTLIEGMRLFPNSLFIGVELEEKFVKWTNASIKKTEKIAKEDWFMKIGKAICLQGDARELEKIWKEKVNKIISSPPYAKVASPFARGTKLSKDKGTKIGCHNIGEGYSKNKKNIGNLSHGDIGKIITSPPWGGQVQHKTNYLGKQKRESGFEYSEDPKNIGNLPHGNVDKIVTSPPFGQAQSGGGIAKKGYTGDKHSPTDLVGKRSYMPENTGEDKKNISNLPYVDKVISSPPYEDQMGRFKRKDKTQVMKDKSLYTYPDECEKTIGSLKGKTYLEAMFLVYWRCYEVLKPDGLMILITKDFIRNKKRVRLGEDTIKLCKMAGFKHIETYHREIKNPSFWRILYEQKYPSADKIDCEDVIVLKK